MAKSKDEAKRGRKRQGRTDMKVGETLTKKRFEKLLTKAAQPVSEWESEKEVSETSSNHPSDGYSGKRKNQGKTGDKED